LQATASHHHQHLHSNNISNKNNSNSTDVAKNNAKDLLEHKMHLNDLENIMRRNSSENKTYQPQPLLHRQASYDSDSSSSPETITNCVRFPPERTAPAIMKKSINTSSPLQNDRSNSEIIKIHHNDVHRESLLDDLCDSLADSNSIYSSDTLKATSGVNTKLEFAWGGSQNNDNNSQFGDGDSNQAHNGNNYVKTNGGVTIANGLLDDKKKSKLLAALKRIDNGSSFEN
jgi:hypothetical protein